MPAEGFAVELFGSGVRINAIEPRAAVASEGANALLGDSVSSELYESMEAMVEGAVALCCCGQQHTGYADVSLDLIEEMGLPVMTLDGRSLHSPA